MHPIDTAKGIGNAIADTASKTIDQAKTDPLGAAKGGLLGVANGLTFGGYKKYLQPALSQAVNGGSFEDAQLRVKDMYDAQGPATTAGELGSVLVPGLGQASLANAAVKAVPTASRLAKVAAGAGAGAVEGAANYVGRSQGPMNLSDASAYMAMGALPGSVMGAANKHTSEQLGNSFIKKAGGDVEAARDAEIVQGLHGLQNRETQGGTALGAKDANALANSYTQKAADAIRKIDPGPERQGLLNALQRGGSMDNEAISALRTSPQGHAVADAIQMQQRTLAMTAAKPANTGTLASAARMAVDNGALGFVPGIGGLLNLKPVRTSVLNMLGGRENRTANISKALKDYEGAVAASKKLGPSAAAKSAQDLQQMGQAAVDAKSALQASQAPFGTRVGRQALDQASSDAEKAATKAAADAEKQKAADIKAAAQRAQDIQKRRDMYTQQRQSDSQAANAERLAAQQQEVRAQQARAQASQGNLENSLQVRQANSADTRSAQTQAMAQQAQAAQAARDRLAGRVAANAENRPVREAPVAPVDPAIAEAAAKARLEARINARVKTNASARAAKAQAAEEAATAQAHAEGAAKAANGEFPDAWDQKSAVQTVLGHVDIDPKDASHIAAVKDTLTKYAAESPENARDVAQFLGKGTKKLEKDKFYGINDRLKAIHGGREPAQAAGSSQGILSESIGPGALSIEDEIRKAKYKGGVANRQNYAKETFQAAPTESVQATVAKMATLKSPEAREALFKAARANATEAEQKFMDRKVEHMIHYRKTE
jgi:hypothetical protein